MVKSTAAPAGKVNAKLLSSLVDTAKILSSSLELDVVLDLVMDTACRMFRSGAASLLLIDEETNTLYFRTASGEKREELKRIRLRMGEGVAGWVAEEGKPLLVNDAREDPRHAREISEALSFDTRSLMCAPLAFDGRTIGVIEVLNRLGGGYDEEELAALGMLGEQVARAVTNARIYTNAQTESERLRELLGERHRLVGESEIFRNVLATLTKAAPTTSTILLRGESGTGKEMMARWVHGNSRRAHRPMISVNCAAITDSLLESELFGYEKGAFTGADRQKKGKFELADGGSIFLDEIATMSPRIQSKLLRVLQEREIDRVGGERPVPIDVRIIAATNADMEERIADGSFREDLFYRLNVIAVTLPPLRSRPADIPLLVDHFIKRYNRETNKNVRGISQRALEILMEYEFPGNVRELQNIVERAIVLEDEELIQAERLPMLTKRPRKDRESGDEEMDVFPTLEDMERRHIVRALEAARGKKIQACRMLGISRPTLDRKLERYDIDVPGRS